MKIKKKNIKNICMIRDIVLVSYAYKNSINVKYLVYCYITIITYTLIPLLPQVLDIILPLNGTRPKVYVFRCDYIFIENDNYYPYIYVHAIIVIFFTIASILSTDFSFLYSVQHACGMFQILG